MSAIAFLLNSSLSTSISAFSSAFDFLFFKALEYNSLPITTPLSDGKAFSEASFTSPALSPHDFAVISLSDLLTPWNLIERRLDAVAAADFVVCLYNPVSRGRPTHLQWACDILLRYKAPETVAGWARSVGREEEKRCVTTLGQLRDAELDMFCTAIVGNIGTTVMEGRMVTPRGYRFGVREEWE